MSNEELTALKREGKCVQCYERRERQREREGGGVWE